MDIPTPEELIAAIDAFLARNPAVKETHIGRAVNNEPGLVLKIRNGRSPSLRTLNKLADYMREQDAIPNAEAA